MHPRRDIGGERALGGPPGGIALLLRSQLLDFAARLQREQFQIFLDVAIVDVDPELVKLVGRRQLGIEVDRACFGFSELLPRRHRDERRDEGVHLGVRDPANQLATRSDVPPLITAAHLQRALPFAEQVQEVVRLQQHVAELGEREPALETRLHRFLLQHDVDRKVLADVAQEIDQLLIAEPPGVVEQ